MTAGGDPAGLALGELTEEYDIQGELGRGATAVVYLGRDRELRREVAIKVIQSHFLGDPEAMARLAREARTVAQLHHPNLVTLYAVRRLRDSGLALIMQYVEGENLRTLLQREGEMSFERAKNVLTDVAKALQYAHARGIVHRDVKPDNIYIQRETGRAMLADFGIARSTAADAQLTMADMTVGTPAYMSPEQIDGDAVDGRSDLYALGIVGWQLLSGRQPWEGETLYGVIYAQKNDELEPIRSVRPSVPTNLVKAIEGCLAKDPEGRWPDAEHFMAALEGRPVSLPPRRAPRAADATSQAGTANALSADPALVAAPTVRWRRGEAPPESGSVPAIARQGALAEAGDLDADDEFERRFAVAPWWRRPAAVGAAAALALVIGAVAITRRPPGDETPSSSPRMVTLGGSVAQEPRALAGTLSPSDSTSASATGAAGTPGGTADDSAIAARTDSIAGVPPSLATPAPATAARLRDSAARVAVQFTTPQATTAGRPAPVAPTRASALPPVVRPGAAPIPSIATTPAESAPAPSVPAATTGGPAATAAGVAAIAPGGTHTCRLTTDGDAVCWGANDDGQLGDGTTDSRTTGAPVSGDLRFASLASGLAFTCGLTTSGTVFCWGSDASGQLGDGSSRSRSSPVRVAGVPRATTVETGAAHACSLSDGSIYCWGRDVHGQLGDGTASPSRSTPARVGSTVRFSSLGLGWNHSCALADGRAYCWGDNGAGELGDGTTTDRAVPTLVDATVRFTRVVAGGAHTCALAPSGQAYCWGKNANGQLGDGGTGDHGRPTPVAGNLRFVALTAGSVHSCGLTRDGSVYCWGRNLYGQLGDGSTADRHQPVRVDSREPMVAVHASGSHTCGTTTSRATICWGYNVAGQLGDGSRAHQSRPVAARG